MCSPGRSKNSLVDQQRQYLRESFDYREKLDVINYHTLHGMHATLNRSYPELTVKQRKTRSKVIRDWLKLRAQVEQIGYSSRSDLKKSRNIGVGTSLNSATEQIIVQCVQGMRNDGIPMAPIILQLKAKELAEEQGISPNSFKGSRD
ncbi:hypothetical protein AaE_002725 [Aphanomyces astaci]|uniref:HTH CENPB-type domain-containing protein n=1 Tax=Aphanomyces astaci TaxID=112090 RepID=A0A6A5ATE5_APHAT|nr:hypothetical protein AaE_002725 [Aphanomyces astaci]